MNSKEKNPLPVFIKADNIPRDVTIFEICAAAEEVSGPVTIDGAICISGLWRISPLYEASRIKILANGISIRGCTIGVENVNPFTLRGDDESVGTKLYIGNLPFSYSSETVKKHLQAAGISLRSNIVWEKARGPDGSLSDWKTGRRMVWINVPMKPLNRFMKMGNGFSATLYYKEMKDSRKCNKCLQYGHIAKYCEQDEVCHTCKKPGHRKGDPICDLGISEGDIIENLMPENLNNEDSTVRGQSNSITEENNTQEARDEHTEEILQSEGENVLETETSGSEWETSEEADDEDQVNKNVGQLNLQNNGGSREKHVTTTNDAKKNPKEEKTAAEKVNCQNKTDKKGKESGRKKKSKSEKKSEQKKGDNRSTPKPSDLKQSQITEYTPRGKRDGSEVFSPDNVASTYGPPGKKHILDK